MISKLMAVFAAILFNASIAGAAGTPAAALLAISKGDTSLAIIDPGSLQIVGRVFTGQDPHEVVASSDGKLAFISNYGGFGAGFHTLSTIDLISQKPLSAVDLGAMSAPHGLTMADGKIYFTAEKSKMIGRYDPQTQKIDWVLGLGQNRTHMIVVSQNEKQIFTSNVNSDTISIIERGSAGNQNGPPPGPPPQDGAGGGPPNGGPPGPPPGGPPGGRGQTDWIVTNVPVGHGPEGFDVSPDGSEVWTANSHDGTVSVIDVANKSVVATLQVQTRMANRLKFTPDGKQVFISDLGGDGVVILDAATRKEIKRLKLGGGAAGILMQPDGSRVYVAAGNGVAVIDLKSLEVTGRIETGKGTDGLAWAVRN